MSGVADGSQRSTGVRRGHGARRAPRVRKAIHQRRPTGGKEKGRGRNTGPNHNVCVCVAIVRRSGSLCVAGSIHTLRFQWESVPSDYPKRGAGATCGNVLTLLLHATHTNTTSSGNVLFEVSYCDAFSFYQQL